MTGFLLHERLAADSHLLVDWPLCQVRLLDQRALPWLLLVPRRPDCVEITDLAAPDRVVLMEEIHRAARLLQGCCQPDKLNLGALGNLVPQLHVHVIARWRHDPAWPGPAWGAVPAAPYGAEEARAVLDRLRAAAAAADA
jgi:diadenosine tetraphosphate (Ap4A) HIT family hydrolase